MSESFDDLAKCGFGIRLSGQFHQPVVKLAQQCWTVIGYSDSRSIPRPAFVIDVLATEAIDIERLHCHITCAVHTHSPIYIAFDSLRDSPCTFRWRFPQNVRRRLGKEGKAC